MDCAVFFMFCARCSLPYVTSISAGSERWCANTSLCARIGSEFHTFSTAAIWINTSLSVSRLHHHHRHHHHTPPPTTTSHVAPCVTFPSCSVATAMMASGQPSRAAQRRRGRRLRWWWRHEQQPIAMALSAVTHHSAQQNGAPWGPKTATRASGG